MGDATRKKLKLEQEAGTSDGYAGTSAKRGICAGASANSMSSLSLKVLLDRLYGTIYGNCIGDAIGLLTEFMNKTKAISVYGRQRPHLEYHMKHKDRHRGKFDTGDWTDDSDQMILILLSLIDNKGKMEPVDYALKLKTWSRNGFKELDDKTGMGMGSTTRKVLHHPQFLEDPHKAATDVWEYSGRYLAPNGGVMRTSVLGIHDFGNIDAVISNTMATCKVTHVDPRCIASCVAVTTAIAMMLQGKHLKYSRDYDVEAVIKDAYNYACKTLETTAEAEELKKYMFCTSLDDLQLDESVKIGYTYKCMGAGFWALRQNNFRTALEAIAYEGGDADTNGAVAGALLGCKLGSSALPPTWLKGLKHKGWLDGHITKFLNLLQLGDQVEK
ncbi:hypothetical protein ABFA07_008860 [Porites harrisoni]